jgi:preprotein translocase subunit SecD
MSRPPALEGTPAVCGIAAHAQQQIVLAQPSEYRGYMSIRFSTMLLGVVFLSATAMQAQAQFSIRAASAQPVEDWQRMQVEHSDQVVWVSPTAAIVASDIEKAQPEVDPVDGATRIAIVFTDAGAQKFTDLTAAQVKKLVAMVVDGKVIWAPMVMGMITGKKGVLYGDGSRGLTQEHVERILGLLRK